MNNTKGYELQQQYWNDYPYKEKTSSTDWLEKEYNTSLQKYKDNGGEAATHFTISEETAEMKLPTDGWDYIGRDKITMDDADVPEDKESGAILNGSEGSYTWA